MEGYMYSICGTTLAIALAALWVVFTPTQPVPPTTTASDPTLPHSPPAHVVTDLRNLPASSCVCPKHS